MQLLRIILLLSILLYVMRVADITLTVHAYFLAYLIMAALRTDADIIFLPCGFFYLLFSSPNLSGRRLDVYHTSTHAVALVRI